jgi:cystathionine beta-synthase
MTETSPGLSVTHNKPPAILSLIGDTPLVEVTQFDTGPCQLFLKLENQNPGGSIKDRIALSMIEAAEDEGKLGPGGTVVEATAGNTGLGLALVAGAKGYRVLLVIPDKMSQEKISHVKALGAEVRITRSDVTRGHPEYYQDVAARLADEIPDGFYVNQFGNPANPLAHERTTGPEIWEQMRHDIDAIVVGVGSGGTLTGLGRFFNRVKPRRGIEMILADPTGSVLYEYVKTGKMVESGSWAVEGIGEDFIPEIADMSLVTDAFEIGDAESFDTARELLRKEGIFGGSSTGTLVAGALRYCREQTKPKRVVSLVPDTGNKYLSKMYNDFWMAEQGFKRMRDSDVSQLPVVDQNGRAIGIIDESDLLVKVHRSPSHFNDPVETAMTDRLETLPPNATIKDLLDVFDRGRVAIVMEDDKFLGLITRTDLLSYLRLHMPRSATPPEREFV